MQKTQHKIVKYVVKYLKSETKESGVVNGKLLVNFNSPTKAQIFVEKDHLQPILFTVEYNKKGLTIDTSNEDSVSTLGQKKIDRKFDELVEGAAMAAIDKAEKIANKKKTNFASVLPGIRGNRINTEIMLKISRRY